MGYVMHKTFRDSTEHIWLIFFRNSTEDSTLSLLIRKVYVEGHHYQLTLWHLDYYLENQNLFNCISNTCTKLPKNCKYICKFYHIVWISILSDLYDFKFSLVREKVKYCCKRLEQIYRLSPSATFPECLL